MCSVIGCTKDGTRFSPLCAAHGSHKKRHGHELQQPVSKTEIKSYAKAVKKWLDTRSTGTAWTSLRDAWAGVAVIAQRELAEYFSGRAKHKNAIEAYDWIVKVRRDAPADDVILTLLAMGYLWEHDQRRFKDTKAFAVQTARAFRKLTKTSAKSYYSHKLDKTIPQYKNCSPRTSMFLYDQLKDTLVRAGFVIAKREGEEVAKIYAAKLATAGDILGDAFI